MITFPNNLHGVYDVWSVIICEDEFFETHASSTKLTELIKKYDYHFKKMRVS